MPEWKPEILRRLAPLKLSPTRETEIVEEIAQHLEDRYEELLVTGQSEDAAFSTAVEELKGEDFLARNLRPVERDLYREPVALGNGSSSFFGGILQDVRYAVRMLRKSPGFTAVAVLTLALGIGANTAIFSVVDAILLRPLPYPEPERLVRVWESSIKHDSPRNVVNPLNFLDWHDHAQSFESMAAISGLMTNLSSQGRPIAVQGMQVTPEFFSTLRVPPLLGRTFVAEDGIPGHERAVILSFDLWQPQYGAEPKIIGAKI